MRIERKQQIMFHPAPYDPTGVSYYSIPSFHFNAGPNLPIRVAYRSFNPTSSRAVCVPTSEHGHINNTLNFANGALKDYHVVVVAMLGNGESSSSSNTLNIPQPVYSTRDKVPVILKSTPHLTILSHTSLLNNFISHSLIYNTISIIKSSQYPLSNDTKISRF